MKQPLEFEHRYCTGITIINPTAASQSGFGDYLEIVALQPGTGTSITVVGTNRICGTFFNAAQTAAASHATACSYSIPFRVGVHMDDADAIASDDVTTPPSDAASADNKHENAPTASGSGKGY